MLIKIIKSQHGFGFFGMMVLVIVLAGLGSIVMVTLTTNTGNQAMQETLAKMDRLAAAITKYKANNSATRPNTLADLISNVTPVAACAASSATSTLTGWCGPYLDVTVSNDSTDYANDGWGTTFSWTPATGTLRSFGPNKVDNAGVGDDIQRIGL